jgi:hypothetical protein
LAEVTTEISKKVVSGIRYTLLNSLDVLGFGTILNGGVAEVLTRFFCFAKETSRGTFAERGASETRGFCDSDQGRDFSP